MKRIFSLILCLTLLLCACQDPPQAPAATTVPTTAAAETPTAAPTEAPTLPETEPTEAPTEAPTEPAVLYRHPLTGMPLDAPMTARPVAVVINNTPAAQPLMGIGSADVFFEHVTEGGGSITRILGVFTDLEQDFVIGSIRSARTYMLDMARAFRAPIVHCGGSTYAVENIRQTGYPSFNEFYYGQYFYRDSERLNAGYSREHTLMTTAAQLHRGLLENGFDLTAPEGSDYGLSFSETPLPAGSTANSICIRFFNDSGKTTTLTYDPQAGVYYGLQQWSTRQEPLADGNTGEPVPIKNVLILNVAIRFAGDGSHILSEMTGQGTGYFACEGKYVPIYWFRESTDQPFTYTLEDGTPITLGIGKTYVAMRPTGSPDIVTE